MKRVMILFFVVCMCVTIVSCGEKASTNSNSATQQVTIENGAFTCEPQTIIDTINNSISNSNDGQYYTCDSFEASGESIFTSDDWSRVILSFDTSDDGYITHCRLYWSSAAPIDNAVATAGLYSTVILQTLSPENADDILDRITEIVVAGRGSDAYDANGVTIEFTSSQSKNWLDVSVSK